MTTQDILAKVASGEIKPDEANKLIDAMKSNGKANGSLTYKVSAKGVKPLASKSSIASFMLCREVAISSTACDTMPPNPLLKCIRPTLTPLIASNKSFDTCCMTLSRLWVVVGPLYHQLM